MQPVRWMFTDRNALVTHHISNMCPQIWVDGPIHRYLGHLKNANASPRLICYYDSREDYIEMPPNQLLEVFPILNTFVKQEEI